MCFSLGVPTWSGAGLWRLLQLAGTFLLRDRLASETLEVSGERLKEPAPGQFLH